MDETSAHRAPDESPVRSSSGAMLRFLLSFCVVYAVLYVLIDGSGPVPAINAGVRELTVVQTSAAAFVLRLAGESVERTGDVLSGSGFFCSVGEGCNGMSAVILVLAGLITFPTTPKRKLAGAAILLPAVLLINVVRISGLFWVGVHRSAWFNISHVYVGQVVVITLTAALWWLWLSWCSRPRSTSPSL